MSPWIRTVLVGAQVASAFCTGAGLRVFLDLEKVGRSLTVQEATVDASKDNCC